MSESSLLANMQSVAVFHYVSCALSIRVVLRLLYKKSGVSMKYNKKYNKLLARILYYAYLIVAFERKNIFNLYCWDKVFNVYEFMCLLSCIKISTYENSTHIIAYDTHGFFLVKIVRNKLGTISVMSDYAMGEIIGITQINKPVLKAFYACICNKFKMFEGIENEVIDGVIRYETNI